LVIFGNLPLPYRDLVAASFAAFVSFSNYQHDFNEVKLLIGETNWSRPWDLNPQSGRLSWGNKIEAALGTQRNQLK